MARPAEFSDDRIRAQIDELAAAGTALSAFAIRRAMGGGNMNRIASVLAEWEATKAPKGGDAEMIDLPVELQAEVDNRMAELSAGLTTTIARIHRRATEIAEGRVTEAVKAARAAATAAETELASARDVVAESDAKIDELEQTLERSHETEERLRLECAEFKEKLAAMTERAESAERQVVELTSRVEHLGVAADTARERAAAAEARVEEAVAERQRAAEEMAELRKFLQAQFDKLKK